MGETFLLLGNLLKWLGFGLSPLLVFPFILLIFPRALEPVANIFVRATNAVSETALRLAMAAAILMLFAQLTAVLARYVFGLSFTWLSETVIYGYATLFLLASASALRDDAHVRVDILRSGFSPRRKAAIEFVGTYLFLLPICGLILWAAISPSFVRAWLNFEPSRESDGLPLRFLFRTLIPLFSVLLIVQGFGQAIKAALVLSGLQTLPDTPDEPDHMRMGA